MKAEGTARAILRSALCVALLAFALGSVWAVVSDYVGLAAVAKGAIVAGHDLGGMTAAQVRSTIDAVVSTPMMQPLTVTGQGTSWALDPKGIVTVDVEAMVAQAYAPKLNAPLFKRLMVRVTGEPLPGTVNPIYSVDHTALAEWVRQVAAVVDTAPVDAKRAIVKYAIRITPEVDGVTVNQTDAVAQIAEALTADAALSPSGRITSLPVDTVKPHVLATSFKRAIVVSLSQCRIRLYNGEKLVKTYPCAPGQPAWPTPTGDFVIVRKQVNAPWLNPHSTWSANMPDMIPGGPGNPMGDRKIGINYPGVFMHGIPPSEYSSIGTHASHGCMRMMPSAVHDLYPRVRIGDPVFIRH